MAVVQTINRVPEFPYQLGEWTFYRKSVNTNIRPEDREEPEVEVKVCAYCGNEKVQVRCSGCGSEARGV